MLVEFHIFNNRLHILKLIQHYLRIHLKWDETMLILFSFKNSNDCIIENLIIYDELTKTHSAKTVIVDDVALFIKGANSWHSNSLLIFSY